MRVGGTIYGSLQCVYVYRESSAVNIISEQINPFKRQSCVRVRVRACVRKLRKLLVCLICNFCIFNNCCFIYKIDNMCQVIMYCDAVNVQPRFSFSNEIIK